MIVIPMAHHNWDWGAWLELKLSRVTNCHRTVSRSVFSPCLFHFPSILQQNLPENVCCYYYYRY